MIALTTFLEKEKVTLCSCLLVNRFWCQISVEILWKSIIILSLFFNMDQKKFYPRMELLSRPQFQNLQCLIMCHFVKFYQSIKLFTTGDFFQNRNSLCVSGSSRFMYNK